MKITEKLRRPPTSTSTSNMNLMRDAADYIDELEIQVADLRQKLQRCFRGDTNTVRNELVLQALKDQTERLLEMPQEDLREYLERKYEI